MADGAVALDTDGKRRFAAFISYAHADAAIAAKLRAKLERYRLPKHIAQGRTGGGAALGQIFRDRDDLAAAPSLSDAIRAAIAEAEALVVICSPEARASRWVGEEIALFRKLHPGRPILAAIVRGEPGEAFPDALTTGGTEPLAADLRAGGDGEALGFLKIVAGIAGVPLDALVQRDAQRRLRRVMWITGGALAAMLVMAVMTTLALQARNEAARQRAASDGLVEYMLTDLREKLRGVGRAEIMDAVNQRALDHYATQGRLASLTDDSLEHRARVLHAMGDDDQRNGNLDRALLRFKASFIATAALLERDPGNPDRIFAHAQSEFYLGAVALQTKDRAIALQHWQGYLKQAIALANVEPESYRTQMELGYAKGNLCELANLNHKYVEAERHCKTAIKHEEDALALKPNDAKTLQDIANRWGWLARVQASQKKYADVANSRQKEAAIVAGLSRRDPKNVEYALRESWASAGLGDALAELGKLDQSRDILEAALAQLDAKTKVTTGDKRIAETRIKILAYLARCERQLNGRVSRNTSDRVMLATRLAGGAELQKIYDAIIMRR